MTGTSPARTFQTDDNTQARSPQRDDSRTSAACAAFGSHTSDFGHVLIMRRDRSVTKITTCRHLYLAHSTDVKIYVTRELNLASDVAGTSYRKCGSFTRCCGPIDPPPSQRLSPLRRPEEYSLRIGLGASGLVPEDNVGIAHTPSEDTVKS